MPDSQIPAQRPPVLQDIPIGIDAHGERREFDSMGDVQVPAGKYWGAQTQRSLVHFSIGNDKMPKEVYHAYGTVKKACALVNEAALASGDVDEATYDKVMDPMSMVGHGAGGA